MMKQLLLLALSLGLTNVCLASWDNKEKLRAYSYKAFSKMPELTEARKSILQLDPFGPADYKNLVQRRATQFFALCSNPDVTITHRFIKESLHTENTLTVFAGLHEDAFTAKVIDNKSVIDITAERVKLMCDEGRHNTDCAAAKELLEKIQEIKNSSAKNREIAQHMDKSFVNNMNYVQSRE